MPPDKLTIESLQTQLTELMEQRNKLQETNDDLSAQNDELKKKIAPPIPPDLAAKLILFFNGPAVGMNSSEKADSIIALLST